MPQDDSSALSSLAGAIYKPVQPSEPTFNPRPVQPSGWEGKTGQIANLATNFLAGVSKGRAQAYDREQQNQMRQVASIQTAIKAVDESGASDEVKKQQKTQLLRLMGELVRGSLPDSPKGKKGGGPVFNKMGEADAQQQQPNGHPMLHAMKGMLDSMLGPPPKKNSVTPEMIDAQLGQVFTTINDQKNSQSAFIRQVEAPFTAVVSEAIKAKGKPLTFAEAMADPKIKAAYDQNVATNNGQPTAGVDAWAKSAQQYEKDQQALALEEAKKNAELAKDDKLTERQKAIEQIKQDREDDRKKWEIKSREKIADLKAKAVKAKGAGEPNFEYLTPERVAAVSNTPANAQGQHPEALQGVPEGIQSLVKQLTSYGLPAATYALGHKTKDNDLAKAIELAPLYDPSFDGSEYVKRLTMKQNYTSGKVSANRRSINQLIGHLAEFKQAVDTLDQSDWTIINKAKNKVAEQYATERQGNLAIFNTAATAVDNELATAFKGTAGTNQEIKEWRDAINGKATLGKGTYLKVTKGLVKLLSARIHELQEEWEDGMGKPMQAFPGVHILDRTARESLKTLGVDPDDIEPAGLTDAPPVAATPANNRQPGTPTQPPPGANKRPSLDAIFGAPK